MANFDLAKPFVLGNEGGYVNNPNDKGGETYAGVARNYYPTWEGWKIVDANKPLEHGQKINSTSLDTLLDSFYKMTKWDDAKLDAFSSQELATYFFDFHVTSGGATKVLQELVDVTADGHIGNDTLNAINNYSGDLLSDLHNARCKYYNDLADNNPQDEQFRKGWLNRANDMYNKLNS